mmetsp:Transcript_119511/g.310002  ORF Transcript_119511/g.310002 Transcript_119511/m.310002 type:complete len:86 (-) Transcript_119511:390-647(-)
MPTRSMLGCFWSRNGFFCQAPFPKKCLSRPVSGRACPRNKSLHCICSVEIGLDLSSDFPGASICVTAGAHSDYVAGKPLYASEHG